jgi:hypothetical protein
LSGLFSCAQPIDLGENLAENTCAPGLAQKSTPKGKRNHMHSAIRMSADEFSLIADCLKIRLETIRANGGGSSGHQEFLSNVSAVAALSRLYLRVNLICGKLMALKANRELHDEAIR